MDEIQHAALMKLLGQIHDEAQRQTRALESMDRRDQAHFEMIEEARARGPMVAAVRAPRATPLGPMPAKGTRDYDEYLSGVREGAEAMLKGGAHPDAVAEGIRMAGILGNEIFPPNHPLHAVGAAVPLSAAEIAGESDPVPAEKCGGCDVEFSQDGTGWTPMPDFSRMCYACGERTAPLAASEEEYDDVIHQTREDIQNALAGIAGVLGVKRPAVSLTADGDGLWTGWVRRRVDEASISAPYRSEACEGLAKLLAVVTRDLEGMGSDSATAQIAGYVREAIGPELADKVAKAIPVILGRLPAAPRSPMPDDDSTPSRAPIVFPLVTPKCAKCHRGFVAGVPYNDVAAAVAFPLDPRFPVLCHGCVEANDLWVGAFGVAPCLRCEHWRFQEEPCRACHGPDCGKIVYQDEQRDGEEVRVQRSCLMPVGHDGECEWDVYRVWKRVPAKSVGVPRCKTVADGKRCLLDLGHEGVCPSGKGVA